MAPAMLDLALLLALNVSQAWSITRRIYLIMIVLFKVLSEWVSIRPVGTTWYEPSNKTR